MRALKSAFLRCVISVLPVKRNAVAVTFHNIPSEYYGWFREMINHIDQRFGFLKPTDIDGGSTNSTGVLLTFDDGFASNRHVAESVLQPKGIKALFFVANGFVGLAPTAARKFAQKNIYTKRSLNKADGCMDAMNWDDVRWLASQGHQICAHTYNHVALSELTSDRKQAEIVEATELLEKKLGNSVRGFAYPFGSLASIDKETINLTRKRFDFAFSNVRGSINESPCCHFLYRQNIVPGSPLWMVDAVIEGRIDWIYRTVRSEAKNRFHLE